jgi:hypothetical protein
VPPAAVRFAVELFAVELFSAAATAAFQAARSAAISALEKAARASAKPFCSISRPIDSVSMDKIQA